MDRRRREEAKLEELREIRGLLEELVDADSGGDGPPECGYNGCGRTVDSADARCWQHEDD